MQSVSFEEVVERAVARDPRFHPDCYEFIREALDLTQQRASERGDVHRHVTGAQLLEGVRLLALRAFGPMAPTVLESWGITRCEHFGEIVFNLIELRFLRKTDSDSREDFKGGFDFHQAFVRPFLPKSRRSQHPEEPAAHPERV